MKKHLSIFTTILLAIILCACNLPKGGSPTASLPVSVGTKVASTLAALTQIAQETPLASPTLLASPTSSQPTFTQLPTLTQPPPLTQSPSLTSTITVTPIPKPGVIAGGISGYPYGDIPRLAIVAFEQEPPYNYSYWVTASGDTYYTLSSDYVIPGKWRVVAYDPDGHTGGCTVFVTVVSDQTVKCDITDWSGSYPAKPSDVPNP